MVETALEAIIQQRHHERGELLTRGFHSEAWRLENVVAKLVRIHSPIAQEDAEILAERIKVYAHALNEVGVNCVTPHVTHPVETERGWYVISLEPDLGNNIESIIREGEPGECIDAVSDVLALFDHLFDHPLNGGSFDLVVGIDPKPANFTYDARGMLHNVDLMPPRYRENGEAIVEFPRPSCQEVRDVAYFKYFDMRGILLDFLGQLCRIRPDLRSYFVNLVEEFAARRPHLAESLSAMPSARFRQTTDLVIRQEIIADLEWTDMLHIRDIACQLIAERPGIPREEFDWIYNQSHFLHEVPCPSHVDFVKNRLRLLCLDSPLVH